MRSDWAPGAALLGTRWAGVSTSKEGQATEGPDVIGPSEEGGVLGRCTISRWTVVTEPMSSLEPCEASRSSSEHTIFPSIKLDGDAPFFNLCMVLLPGI